MYDVIDEQWFVGERFGWMSEKEEKRAVAGDTSSLCMPRKAVRLVSVA